MAEPFKSDNSTDLVQPSVTRLNDYKQVAFATRVFHATREETHDGSTTGLDSRFHGGRQCQRLR